jgi:two-component system sensor histidine kinase/response regulator
LGGKIWVKSEVGHGSTFHFTSRFNVSNKAVEATAVLPPVVQRAQGLHILVADDNAINRLVAIRILELAGHHAVLAVNGQDVLNALQQAAFDVVLMDVQMPIMDGFEATALIRAKEKGSGQHMPIVAMTAHAMKGDRERCLEAGMDGYVSKPIEEQDLFCAIESAIGGVKQLVVDEIVREEEVDAASATTDLLEIDSIENDKVFQQELAQIFLEDCPMRLSEIHEAVATRNGPALMLASQSLKSSAEILNDGKATDAALRMENVGRDVDWNHAAAASAVLTREITRLSAAMIDVAMGGNFPPTIELPHQELTMSSTTLPTVV